MCGRRSGDATVAADSRGAGCNLFLHLDSFGQPRSNAPPWFPGNQWSQFPSRREERGRDGQPVCEGPSGSTDGSTFLSGGADSGPAAVIVCRPVLRSHRDGYGSRGSPHRPGSEAAGRTGNFPARELPELLRGCTQGAEGCLAPPATGFFAGGLAPPSPGHLAYECNLSGDFPSGSPTSTLPRGIAAIFNGGSSPVVREGFPSTRRSLPEQLLSSISTGNPAGLPRQEYAVRAPSAHSDGSVHTFSTSHEVSGHQTDNRDGHGRWQGSPSGLSRAGLANTLVQPLSGAAAESAAESGVGGSAGGAAPQPPLPGDRAPEDFAPPPAPPDTRPSLGGPPPPLPATGIGFKCLSRRCRDKLPYATAAGYVQHLNQQHKLEEAHSLRLPMANRLPDIVKCRDCNHFCQNARGLQAHRRGPMHAGSVIPPVVVGPSPPSGAAPVVPDPLTPDPSIEAPLLTDTELLDLFQRPLYDIHRAWRAPLFRIVRRLSQAILDGTPQAEDKCTLAFLLLPGLVAECHFG